MTARPGKLQSAFTSGELVNLLDERYELKYRENGLSHAENVIFAPQGGFRMRPGLQSIDVVASDAARLFPFKSSAGLSYDIVLRPAEAAAYDATVEVFSFSITGLTADMLAELSFAQDKDTMLLFHEDLQTKRIIHVAAANWTADNLPYANLPDYDYGGTYVNGVAAQWQIEFVGLTATTTLFTLTVSNETTTAITYQTDMTVLATAIQAAILALPNVASGATAVSASGGASGTKIDITFSGTDNIANGDGWAVSGIVIAEASAAIVSSKTIVGVAPGEPVISVAQGWPACGAFLQQRLFVGGLKALPGAYMFSVQADYFNMDTRFSSANGAQLVPMQVESGEKINAIVDDRNPVIMTSEAEYWLAERAISAVDIPNHVQSGNNGTKRGVPVVKNESALLYIYASGSVLGEYRYTDVNGNYLPSDISLLASHLVVDVVDQARQRATLSNDGNKLALVLSDGAARLATILREQEVTGFARLTSAGASFKAVCVNGRNEMGFLTQRPDARYFERLNDNYLLDEAVDFVHGPASDTITGLARFNGREVWVVADNDIFGPYTVAGGQIILPIAASAGYVGTWAVPVGTTLPVSHQVGPGTVVKRRRRIHSCIIHVIDTTSLALSANGGPLREIPLQRYGMQADIAELDAGYTGPVLVRGFYGYVDEPTLTVSHLRPGRLHVRSITTETS